MSKILFWIILVIVLIVMIMIAEIYRETHTFKITRYKIISEKIQGDHSAVKLLFLSDLHNCSYGSSNEQLFTSIEKEGPDLILIGGDMLVGKEGEPCDVAREFVRRLPNICPVYYANGNHEQRIKENQNVYGDMYNEYKTFLEKAGVHFLENQCAEIVVKGTSLRVYGLELLSSVNKKFKKADVRVSTIQNLIGPSHNDQFENPSFEILMAHNPAYMDVYKAWGADLILSGHLHGGLIRCPGIGGIVTPQGFFFPKYSGEMRQDGKQTTIVSRGLGTHTINVRLFNTPELISLEINGNND